MPVVFQPPCRGCPSAAARNSTHITVILKISCIAAPKLAARTAAIEAAHILRLFYLCCLCRCGQQSASRMDFSVYRPILQAGNFCAILHFSVSSLPCPATETLPLWNIPQIPVQKCGILQDFVLYWIKNQHSRAAPGTKEATHEQHHRGKTRGHPQQRQPDAVGGHRRTFAGFMDFLACPQAERLLHRHSGMHVGTDIFDYAAYIWAAYQLRV